VEYLTDWIMGNSHQFNQVIQIKEERDLFDFTSIFRSMH
jgi:hypothetical protein